MNLPYSAVSFPPSVPTNLVFISASSSSITFSFVSPNRGVSSYKVTVVPVSWGSMVVKLFGSPNTSYTITGLIGGTSYNVSIVANNLYGSSSSTGIVIMSTQ